jgi:hypothetical protein
MTRPWSPVQVMQWSKHNSKKPRDQTREDDKLRGPSQKSVKSCEIRSYIQFGEKLTTRAHMQKGEGSRRLGNRDRAKEAANWAEVRPGRPAQSGRPSPAGPAYFGAQSHPLWPRCLSGYLYPPDREPRRNQFVILRRGAEKLEGHHLGEEGRASCLGSP